MSQSSLIDLSSVRVLCMDDDPVMRSVIRSSLQRRGCRDVVQANGGMDALDLCAGRTFDLLICDFQMTPMNGLDFLRALGNSGLGLGWPVIMLSAETNPETIQQAQELGISAWVGKPVSVHALIERVSAVMRLHGKVAGSGKDGELTAMVERYHARLMAALNSAEEVVQSIGLRPREAAGLAHGLRHGLEEINEHARTLGYGLISMLDGRCLELVGAMVRNPAAAARGHTDTARVLKIMLTAMKRVAQNRMEGDGAEGGLKLLDKIDRMADPVRAALD